MSAFWVYAVLLMMAAVLGVNVFLGGYLFLAFVSTLAQTKRPAPWMIAYAVGSLVFVVGLGLLLDGGGLWFLCANVLILGFATALSRRQWIAQAARYDREP